MTLADQTPDFRQLLQRYNDLASSVGTMQCASCDCRNSIHIEPSESDISNSKLQLSNSLQNVQCAINSFDCGEIGVELFFERVSTVLFPHLSTLSDAEAWKLVILNILRLVVNPERRVNFQLRYLRNRPRVWSPCHDREQCFRCKTKNYHEGKTCAQVCDQYTNDVLSCPQCGVFLVKGDGCDSVRCVCGKNFSFNNLMKAQRNARQFAEDFPHNTPWMCVRVLCKSSDDCQPDPSVSTARYQQAAAAWSKEFPVETEQALLQWWLRKYPQYTAQCSVAPLPAQTAEGIVRARRLFRQLHATQVSHAELQIQIAKSAMVDTFYASPSDKKERLLVEKLLYKTSDSTIIAQQSFSGRSQVAKTSFTEAMKAALLVWRRDADEPAILNAARETHMQQFLVLFGHLPLKLYRCDNSSHDQAEGLSIMVVRKNAVTGRPENVYAVGDDIEVAYKKEITQEINTAALFSPATTKAPASMCSCRQPSPSCCTRCVSIASAMRAAAAVCAR